MQAESKWDTIIGEVNRRVMHCISDKRSAMDLVGDILEHLVKLESQSPQLGILDNSHYRARTITNKIRDWLRTQKAHRARFLPIMSYNPATGDEYEMTQEVIAAAPVEDDQFLRMEISDSAEAANREIRKHIGKRGTQVLDAILAHDTLSPMELATVLGTRAESINSQMYAIRQKGKSLSKNIFDFGSI